MKIKITIFLLFLLHSVFSQEKSNEIEAIISDNLVKKSNKIAFVDVKEGKLVSSAKLSQPLFNLTLNEEVDVFYAQTRNYIYKGKISTGEITDEFLAFEKLETLLGVDLSMFIMPIAINKNGVAHYSYMKDAIEGQREASKLKGIKRIKKIGENASKTDAVFYEVNINEKSKKEIDINEYPLVKLKYYTQSPDDDENNIKLIADYKDIYKPKLQLLDVKTGDVIRELEPKTVLKINTELKHLSDKVLQPWAVNEDLFCLTIIDPGPVEKTRQRYVLCSFKQRKVLSNVETKDMLSGVHGYPLKYTNSQKPLFVSIENNTPKKEPMPVIESKGFAFGGMKKLKKFQARLDEWSAKEIKRVESMKEGKFYNLNIFKDKEHTKKICTINNVLKANYINDSCFIAIRPEEIVKINAETGEKIWAIPFNFNN